MMRITPATDGRSATRLRVEGRIANRDGDALRAACAPLPEEPDGLRVELTGVSFDAPLVARLRAGDELAFETLVRRHGGRMLATARRLLRDDEAARDALQEAFLSACAAMDRFDGRARLSTWLHRIVINCALMRLRRQRRRQEGSIEELLPRFA